MMLIFISIHSIKKECYVTSLVCCPMQVQVPCYILQSHADLAIPPENVKYLSDNLGGRSAYELMHTTGHLPQLSHPAVVVSALQRAIAWVWTSKHHQNSSASYYWLSLKSHYLHYDPFNWDFLLEQSLVYGQRYFKSLLFLWLRHCKVEIVEKGWASWPPQKSRLRQAMESLKCHSSRVHDLNILSSWGAFKTGSVEGRVGVNESS